MKKGSAPKWKAAKPFRHYGAGVRQRARVRRAMFHVIFAAQDAAMGTPAAIEKGRAFFLSETGVPISKGHVYAWLKLVRERGGRSAPLSAFCDHQERDLPAFGWRLADASAAKRESGTRRQRHAVPPSFPSKDAVRVVLELRRLVQAGVLTIAHATRA